VFDRVTGEPVWPIEELAVPQSTVAGEKTAPTQPHPTKPPAFERQGVTVDDLIDFTPELRAKALEIVKDYTMGPLFTPPSLIDDDNKGTLMLPSPAGGANWMGACVDPETGIMYVPSMSWIVALGVREQTNGRSEFSHTLSFGDFGVPTIEGLPIVKPPYGRITAIDLNKGENVWQVPHGQGPTDHPLLKDLNLGPLGAATNGGLSNGGGFVTKSLLFMNQPDPDGTNTLNTGKDGVIRAFSKKDGAELWEHRLGKVPRGTPMTYMHEGKQYVVVAVGGAVQESELVALTLP
jgi:quinoprotein glucose dehydrogenase